MAAARNLGPLDNIEFASANYLVQEFVLFLKEIRYKCRMALALKYYKGKRFNFH